METLKSYLYTAMLAALVSSMVLRLSEPRYRKYIRFGVGLCLLLTMIMPILTVMEEVTDINWEAPELTQAEGESRYMDMIGQEMSNQIACVVANRYRISRDVIRVKITLDLTDLSAISLIRVDLTILCPCEGEEIQDYLTKSLDCPVEVHTEDRSE